MAIFDVSQLKQDAEAAFHGTTLNDVQNFYGIINRASRKFLRDIDPQETKRMVLIGPVFNGVFDYSFIATDVKGNRIIDLRPQVDRSLMDKFGQDYNQDFDIFKDFTLVPSFTPQFDTGVKTIRINNPRLLAGILVNQIDGVSTNGAWSAIANAQNIATDNVNFAAGAGSVSFDLAQTGIASSTGYIENSTMASVDLTTHLNQGTEFIWVYLPVASSVSSIELRWGSSASAYWSLSVATTYQGNAFNNGWNLLSFKWASSTKTGSPDVTKINYSRLTFTYDGTLQTGVHANGLNSRLGVLMQLWYYSKFLFRDAATKAWMETVSSDSDLINLDTESYDIFFNLVAHYCVQQIQGLDALFSDGPLFEQLYVDGITRYKALYKSEVTKPSSIYYRKPNNNYRRWFGRKFNF